MVIRNFKYKLYINKHMWELNQLVTSINFAWNHILRLARKHYKLYHHGITTTQLQKHMAKLRKKDPYWKKLGSQTMQEVCERYNDALAAHFGKKLKRGFPKPKKCFHEGSIVFKQGVGYKLWCDGNKGYLVINAIGNHVFKFKLTQPYGEVRRISIMRDYAQGCMYLIVTCKVTTTKTYERCDTGHIGMDFGLKHFLTTSDGMTMDIPDYHWNSLTRIKAADRSVSRKRNTGVYGTSYRRARKHANKLKRRVANRRSDFQWKLAHKLCRENVFISIEDLNLQAMKKLWGRKISSYAFGEFVRKLMYVATKYGTVIHKIGCYEPSSQLCSNCGYRYKGVKDLRVRQWECPECHTVHDRDVNAARNILRIGLNEVNEKSGKGISHGISGSKTYEAKAEYAAVQDPNGK